MGHHPSGSTCVWPIRWILFPSIVAALIGAITAHSDAKPLVTYITGDTPADGQVVFRAQFDSAVKDSAILTIVAKESDPALRLDNIDFVPGSSFSEVVVTAQSAGDGALTRYNVKTGAELPDVISSTNAVAVPPPSGASRPASIVPDPTGTYYYYTENQFGFAGGTHRMMQVPIGGGVEKVAYDGLGDGLVEFSGAEIIEDRMYFFAHDPAGPAAERQLYSVPLDAAGIASGPAVLEVFGLDRSSGVAIAAPGSSDGSDEMDFDPSTGLLYGTNIGTGETIGFDPATGPAIGVGALPFHIDDALVTAAAAVTVDDGLGLLSGVATPPGVFLDGPERQIDGIRPDGDGHLVVMGHNGVMVSIDIKGVLVDGADDSDIIRLFNADFPGAGTTIGFSPVGLAFDDHTVLAPVPEPATIVVWSALAAACFGLGWRRRRRAS